MIPPIKNQKSEISNLFLPLAGVAALSVVLVCACAVCGPEAGWLLTAAGLAGLGMSFLRGDAALRATKALPASDGTAASDGFDLELTERSDFLAAAELLIEAPALVVGDLANESTVGYSIYHATAANFADETLLAENVLVQAGAGGAGAAAASARFRFPLGVNRYVRVKATHTQAGSGSDDPTDKTFTTSLTF